MKFRLIVMMVFVWCLWFGSVSWGATEKSGLIYYPKTGAEAIAMNTAIEARGIPATIKFVHTGSGVSTPYVFDEDVTFSELITLENENAAVLVASTGIDVVLPPPGNIVAGPNQKIFDGEGSFTFSSGGVRHVGWWGFDESASGTANALAVNSAMDAYSMGTILYPVGSFNCDYIDFDANNLVHEGGGNYRDGTTLVSTVFGGVSFLFSATRNTFNNIAFSGGSTATKAHVTGYYIDFYKCRGYAHTTYQVHSSGIDISFHGGNYHNTGSTAPTAVMVVEWNDTLLDDVNFNGGLKSPGVLVKKIDRAQILNFNMINCELESGISGQLLISSDMSGLSINDNYWETESGQAYTTYHMKIDDGVWCSGDVSGNLFGQSDFDMWIDRISHSSVLNIVGNSISSYSKVDVDYDSVADNYPFKMPTLNFHTNGRLTTSVRNIQLDNDAWRVEEIRCKHGASLYAEGAFEIEFSGFRLETANATETSLFEVTVPDSGSGVYPRAIFLEAKVSGRDASGSGTDINWYQDQVLIKNTASAAILGSGVTVAIEDDVTFDFGIDVIDDKARVRCAGKSGDVNWIGDVTIKRLW